MIYILYYRQFQSSPQYTNRAIKFAGENHQESVVVFERAEDARLALHLTGTKLAERKLMIQPYQLPQQITRKPPARQQQQQHQRVLDLVALGRTLLINRLSREVKETELERVLFQGLQVKSIRLIVSDSTAIGEQKALVEFSTVEDAKNGLDRNGKQFKGTVLE
jgi:hypothetical protein